MKKLILTILIGSLVIPAAAFSAIVGATSVNATRFNELNKKYQETYGSFHPDDELAFFGMYQEFFDPEHDRRNVTGMDIATPLK